MAFDVHRVPNLPQPILHYDINDKKEAWRLAVRIIDSWSVVNSKIIEHLEMVIVDPAGDRIQILICVDLTPKWKSRIQENMTCIINNNTVFDNIFHWKLCDHFKKIVFLDGTILKAINVQNLPPMRYYFKEFSEILRGKCQLNRLEDDISVIHEINNMQSNTPGKKTFVSLNLKDLSGNFVNCTLWESYGCKFLDYYNDANNSGAIIIILTHAMIKDSQGLFIFIIGEDDPMVYPDELDMLLGNKMTFRAKAQSLPVRQNGVIDHVDISMESLSAFGENDPDKSLASTPSKDVSATVDVEDSDF
ncbi:uncharacterized protein LOC131636802 [Vicia villosa]|uniref:uncharacterized protein LOC131636802 n=1 Tax=Vicia villosa TaxID=3911 RepID=UPI00273AB888|nr:uncharacterized protein LOC131636802 [Vicia villosa]